jgi:RimJ/RimL family protein N-acetyltransferase
MKKKAKSKSTKGVELRALDDKDLAKVQKYQNKNVMDELSGLLDSNFSWTPMTTEQIKAKVDEIQKEKRTSLFGIYSKDNKFVGVGFYSEGWDTWQPYFYIIIWPEYRQKGYGSSTLEVILDGAFNQGVAHVIACCVAEWNVPGLKFVESMGFKNAGVQRRTHLKDGKFRSGVFFDMLRDEYLDRHPKGGDK